MTARAVSLAARIAELVDPSRPSLIGGCDRAASMIGVARLLPEDVDGLWEQHDGGDEVLVIISGSATLRTAEHAQRVSAGEVVIIPRGVPHSFRIDRPELQLLYVTPHDGNRGWSEDGRIAPKRHA